MQQADVVRKQETCKRICYKLRRLLRLERLVPPIWRRIPIGSYSVRMHFDAVPRPHYAYGIYTACMQAKALGLSRVAVLEFGVAGGNGLVAMENAADRIARIFDLTVDVYGFDVGTGLPASTDYRDLPYFFVHGSYEMDVEKLRKRLRRAEVIIGPIAETIPAFMERFQDAHIGFCVFDLDYYTSTVDALTVLEGDADTRLPRVICYFDDIFGISDMSIYCDRVGPQAAISELNARLEDQYLAPIEKLRNNRAIPDEWNDRVYAYHDFSHPLYNKVINPYSAELATQSLSLR
jgi:hypothetical protein